MTTSLWTGAALGLSVAVPLGPISLLCVQNTLANGYGQGVITGFGAATAQGLFAAAAILGEGLIATALAPWTDVIRVLSGALLVVLGIRILLQQRTAQAPRRATNWRASYASTLVLALSNPMTILPYVAVATVTVEDAALSAWSIPGVMLAASTWYALLSGVTTVLRRGMPVTLSRSLNIGAAGVMIASGLVITLGHFHH